MPETTYKPETSYTLDTHTGQIAPTVDDAEIRRLDDDYLLRVYARLPVTLVRGQGVRVWDAGGKELFRLSGRHRRQCARPLPPAISEGYCRNKPRR